MLTNATFCFRNAESEYIVLFSVSNHSRMCRAYRIFRIVQASDIGRSRDRSNVPSCRYNYLYNFDRLITNQDFESDILSYLLSRVSIFSKYHLTSLDFDIIKKRFIKWIIIYCLSDWNLNRTLTKKKLYILEKKNKICLRTL